MDGRQSAKTEGRTIENQQESQHEEDKTKLTTHYDNRTTTRQEQHDASMSRIHAQQQSTDLPDQHNNNHLTMTIISQHIPRQHPSMNVALTQPPNANIAEIRHQAPKNRGNKHETIHHYRTMTTAAHTRTHTQKNSDNLSNSMTRQHDSKTSRRRHTTTTTTLHQSTVTPNTEYFKYRRTSVPIRKRIHVSKAICCLVRYRHSVHFDFTTVHLQCVLVISNRKYSMYKSFPLRSHMTVQSNSFRSRRRNRLIL